jgi:acetolactate synthase-1/2/3 large subunit
MGTMGYSLPAAIGAKLADPSRSVCAICGDGSLQMSMMELATAVQHDVPVKLVVMTYTRFGIVRLFQTKGYDDRQTAVFLDGSPDFTKLAEAYGIPSMLVSDEESMNKAIDMLAHGDGRLLVEVVVDKDFPKL